MEEQWKKIEGYNNYSVSNFGRVRNDKRNHMMSPTLRSKNSPYFAVCLTDNDGKAKRKNVHRLVAEAFIPNPNCKPQINHKDGDKENNHYSNLEWVTSSENSIHAYKLGLKKSTSAQIQKAINATKRPIINRTLGTIHESIVEAAKYIGGQGSGISKCLSGEREHYKGMHFAYLER